MSKAPVRPQRLYIIAPHEMQNITPIGRIRARRKKRPVTYTTCTVLGNQGLIVFSLSTMMWFYKFQTARERLDRDIPYCVRAFR